VSPSSVPRPSEMATPWSHIQSQHPSQETRHDCSQDQPNRCELDQIHHRAIDGGPTRQNRRVPTTQHAVLMAKPILRSPTQPGNIEMLLFIILALLVILTKSLVLVLATNLASRLMRRSQLPGCLATSGCSATFFGRRQQPARVSIVLGEVFPSMTGISKSSIICSKASLYAP
jgi:hypothetical protein